MKPQTLSEAYKNKRLKVSELMDRSGLPHSKILKILKAAWVPLEARATTVCAGYEEKAIVAILNFM